MASKLENSNIKYSNLSSPKEGVIKEENKNEKPPQTSSNINGKKDSELKGEVDVSNKLVHDKNYPPERKLSQLSQKHPSSDQQTKELMSPQEKERVPSMVSMSNSLKEKNKMKEFSNQQNEEGAQQESEKREQEQNGLKSASQTFQKQDKKGNGRVLSSKNIQMVCPRHRKDIIQVCSKKGCRDTIFHCEECINDFADHVNFHKPFISFEQFLYDLECSNYTKRKERVEELEFSRQDYVKKFESNMESEKMRIQNEIIPQLKGQINSLIDQLETSLFERLDSFRDIYSHNSNYLFSYLENNGLLFQIIEQGDQTTFASIIKLNICFLASSCEDIIEKFSDSPADEFLEYIESVYRSILDDDNVERTRQAFGYFEEIYDIFRKQSENVPQFQGENEIMSMIKIVVNEFIRETNANTNQYSTKIIKYPICSSCSQEIDNNLFNSKIQALEASLKKTLNQKSRQSTSSSKEQLEEAKQIQKEIERLRKSRPGYCKGCNRLYCSGCQFDVKCKGCRIEFDPQLKTSKFSIKENKNNLIAMLDDTAKQQPIYLVNSDNVNLIPSLSIIQSLLKKHSTAIIIANQQYYSGRIVWEVTVENFGSCHNLAFGLAKLDILKEELNTAKDFKDFTDKKSLILLSSSGIISGGLKGKVVSFQKDRNAAVFSVILDFGKNKFTITGKGIYLEMELENNQGYTPCFYSGCCFKSYNNFAIKQIYSFDPLEY